MVSASSLRTQGIGTLSTRSNGARVIQQTDAHAPGKHQQSHHRSTFERIAAERVMKWQSEREDLKVGLGGEAAEKFAHRKANSPLSSDLAALPG
eukprot:2858187-Alexandrium_andersonii.AAC.1